MIYNITNNVLFHSTFSKQKFDNKFYCMHRTILPWNNDLKISENRRSEILTLADWGNKIHSRFPFPPQFISQMFFANITTVPISPTTLPSASSPTSTTVSPTTRPPCLNFDGNLIPYITSTTATTTTATATVSGITSAKSMIRTNENILSDDRRTSLISWFLQFSII